MSSFRCLVSAYVLLLVLPFGLSELVELTDATFEHQTQASTGMTTGSWFVLFKAERCGHCQKVMPELEKLADDTEFLDQHSIVLATVDVPSNRRTTMRFGVRGFPTLLFLHRKQWYEYSGRPRTYEDFREFLLDISTTTATSHSSKDIPPPLSAYTEFLSTMKAVYDELAEAASGKSGVAGYMVLGMVVMLSGILAGLIAMCFLPAQKVKAKSS